jgi:hypothetical protein
MGYIIDFFNKKSNIIENRFIVVQSAIIDIPGASLALSSEAGDSESRCWGESL